MKVKIESIPHREHRYPTIGDFFTDVDNDTVIRVSSELSPKHQFLVTLHEFIESQLCRFDGVSWLDIDEFDKNFEEKRDKSDTSEPGDQTDAPYKRQHQFAEQVERQVAKEMGVDWEEYMRACEALYNIPIKKYIKEEVIYRGDGTHFVRRID